MENSEEKILEIKKEIASLPKGYISNKTINGKVRKYYQWTEDGVKKSRYLNDEKASEMEKEIERRRMLESELKSIIGGRKERTVKYKSHILTGETLRLFSKKAEHFTPRPLLKPLERYLNNDGGGRIFILYGLRRTGKTTLIQEALRDFDDNEFRRAAFIEIMKSDTLSSLNQDLKKLLENGYKYVFIDEVTLLEDFIEGAALFSDIYASCGMKIVLSGTDSLGFIFAEDEQLYDRCEMAHTTFIPYGEFESVLSIHGIDEYIRYGGTMSLGGVHYNKESTFASIGKTDEYIDTSIAKNIQHSLKYYQNGDHFRNLEELYERNELTSVINRVVEDMNHRFTLNVLTRDFFSNDLALSSRNLRRDREEPSDILDSIDIEAFTSSFKKALEIRNRNEQSVEITDAHRIEIKEYLDLLELTFDIPVHSLPVTDEKKYMTVITQPGMRYSQARELVKELMFDSVFERISVVERSKITERILDEIRGRMMEEIVLLETTRAYPEKEVFKLKFSVGEFDMVVYDPENITSEIYEIKHSGKIAKEQYRHLIDQSKCSDTEFRYGPITRKCVLYRGGNTVVDDIEYMNVEDYLKNIWKRMSDSM